MSRRGENIYKRKDGRWEGRFIKEHDRHGKVKYGYVYARSYREVKEKLFCARQSKDNVGQDKLFFDFYCDEWLTVSRNRIKESSYVKYYNTVNRYIKPHFKSLCTREITTPIVEDFSNTLLKEGLSTKSVKDILIILKSILKYSRRTSDEDIKEIDIIFPKEAKKEMRVLSVEEQKRFAEFLMTDIDDIKFGILLALLTGMRIGEVCALRWENISLEHKLIKVNKTMQRLQCLNEQEERKTKISVDEAKSQHSIRLIPMTETAILLCQERYCGKEKAFVLTGEEERFIEPRMLQYRFARYAKECGLSEVHFHTLRHTFATRCVEVGFEIKSLSEILGHSSAKITLDRYVHSSIALKRENMEKLAAVGL